MFVIALRLLFILGMLPKFPQTYRIPARIQAEIDALVSDLDLVLVSKSFVSRPYYRVMRDFTSPLPRFPLVDVKSGISCRDFNKRNHHRSNFKDVYPSNNNYKELSFSWD